MYTLHEYTHVCIRTNTLPVLKKPRHPASSSDSLRTLDKALFPSRHPPLTRDPLLSRETSSLAALNGPAVSSALKKFPEVWTVLESMSLESCWLKLLGIKTQVAVGSHLSCPIPCPKQGLHLFPSPTSSPTCLPDESPGLTWQTGHFL